MKITIQSNGALGAVISQSMRDARCVLKRIALNSSWQKCHDSGYRNLIIQYSVPVEIGGIWIKGNIVFEDINGVVIILKYLSVFVLRKFEIKKSALRWKAASPWQKI